MNRAGEIRGRMDNVRQIGAIVSALRALAVSQRREAERHLEAIRTHAATIADALAAALAGGATPVAQEDGGRGVLIVVGAAQGFGGSYGDGIAEAALAGGEPRDDLMVIGQRTVEALEARGAPIVWSADMAAHAADLPALASRVADAAFELLAEDGRERMTILHAAPSSGGATSPSPARRRRLAPFDFDRFPPRAAARPLITLPRETLLAGLVREYVFTELCEGLAFGFAAENEARAAAMARAQSNIRRIADDLDRAWRRARQEGMTEEITALAQQSRG